MNRTIPAIAFLLVAAWFYLRTVHYSAPSHVEMSTMPLETLDGTPFPSQSTADRAILVNFWAPWCDPCRSEMPALQRLHSEHRDITVIGIEDDPDQYANAVMLADQTGISYPLLRFTNSVRSTFGHVVSLPTTLFISRSGKVLHTVNGTMPDELMLRYAQEAIAAN